MPRNASGTYTLPTGNPVVSGTLIDATWANGTLNDVANTLTGSLSRSGEGGMLAPLRLNDGVQATPGLAFSNEPSTGLYRAGTNEMWAVAGGTQVLQITSNGAAARFALGAASTPSLTFLGDTNTGFYSPGADQIALATNGVQRLSVDAAGAVTIGGALAVTGGITANLTGNVTGNVSGTAANVTGTVAVANGGTGATSASVARTNLGLAIGTDIPSPSGTGASGTWGISISGNAATATTSTNQSGGTVSATTGTFSSTVGLAVNQLIGSGNGYAGNSTAASSATLQLWNSTDGFTRLSNAWGSGAILFSVGGTEQGRFTTTGLGIGTTSPSRRLEVASSTAALIRITSSGAQTGYAANEFYNAAGFAYCGTESSAAGTLFSGTTAYATVLGNTAAYPLQLATNNTVRATIDSSGNLGIGTTSPGQRLAVRSADNVGTTNIARFESNNAAQGVVVRFASVLGDGGNTTFGTLTNNATLIAVNNSEVARFDTSGNLGIGTASPSTRLQVNGGYISQSDGTVTTYMGSDGTGSLFGTITNQYLRFVTNNTERARITSGGNLLVGDSSAVSDERLYVRATASTGYAYRFYNTQATAGSTFGQYILYTASSPNGTSNQFLRCDDSTTTRAEIRSNGGLANFQANNVNLSDARTKKDIAPLGSVWDKFKAIEIVKFKYRDQTHDDYNIGVIAQQVEAVAPEFVDADGFGKTPEDGVPLKTIYTADMYHAAIRALQEAMSRIEKLEGEVSALNETKN